MIRPNKRAFFGPNHWAAAREVTLPRGSATVVRLSRVIVTELDGLPVRLRAPHDLSFAARWGRVFAVLDQQDSGNLCLGIEGPAGRVFVKYAGAPTPRYDGAVGTAVANLRRSTEVYRALAHPSLVRLREAVDVGAGHALVFDWTDATPLGRQYDRWHVVRSLPVSARTNAVQQIYDFHVHAAARGCRHDGVRHPEQVPPLKGGARHRHCARRLFAAY